MFYLSAYLEAHRDVYYQRLQMVSKTDKWDDWISFFLTAVIEQAAINADKVRSILNLYEQMKGRIVEITHSQFAIQTLDAFFSRPIFRASDFSAMSGIPTKQTAASIIRRLQHAGILKTLAPARGRRSAMLAFSELINLVEGGNVV